MNTMKNYKYSYAEGDVSISSATDNPSFLANQNINEILVWLVNIKKSNNYILDEVFKKHIDSFFDFTKSLKDKGIVSINQQLFNQALINSNNLLIDLSTCVGSDGEIKACKLQKYGASPVSKIVDNMFLSLWNDDENRRIKDLQQKNLISQQQADKLRKEQEKKAREESEKLRIQKENSDKEAFRLNLQAIDDKKKKNQKMLVLGGITILSLVGAFIIYKKVK